MYHLTGLVTLLAIAFYFFTAINVSRVRTNSCQAAIVSWAGEVIGSAPVEGPLPSEGPWVRNLASRATAAIPRGAVGKSLRLKCAVTG